MSERVSDPFPSKHHAGQQIVENRENQVITTIPLPKGPIQYLRDLINHIIVEVEGAPGVVRHKGRRVAPPEESGEVARLLELPH